LTKFYNALITFHEEREPGADNDDKEATDFVVALNF